MSRAKKPRRVIEEVEHEPNPQRRSDAGVRARLERSTGDFVDVRHRGYREQQNRVGQFDRDDLARSSELI
jgi:hypothetical protein